MSPKGSGYYMVRVLKTMPNPLTTPVVALRDVGYCNGVDMIPDIEPSHHPTSVSQRGGHYQGTLTLMQGAFE